MIVDMTVQLLAQIGQTAVHLPEQHHVQVPVTVVAVIIAVFVHLPAHRDVLNQIANRAV